ncbi:MAG: N-acetylmuramoyl-L-alanine amidase, partial [Christensenellaceae bacterium]|nr:N-acetylmuramoyl-L-alanine amidase [Christensenellaceae bacterium]
GQPDGGTTGVGGPIEEELNLEIAEKLKTELEHRGYLVAMTRTDHDQVAEDKDADMEERRRMLTDSGQDITISIHQNYYEADAEVSGPQVFHASGSVYGEKLAELIQRKLNEQLQPSSPREHTVGDFYIVRSGGAPCALVECGFLSNAEEEEKLADDSYQRRLVSAIADGIDAYF